MQLRVPYENGKYAYGCLLATSSGKNLAGSNLRGSGQLSGSLCVCKILNITEAPSGIIYSPAINES